MGKSRCLYCGVKLPPNGPFVKIGINKLSCTKCYEEYYKLLESERTDETEQGSDESDVNLFGEKMNEFEVTFHLISGRQITLTDITPDADAGCYTLFLIQNQYNIYHDDDGHTIVVNMKNVTSFNVRKKEKEE